MHFTLSICVQRKIAKSYQMTEKKPEELTNPGKSLTDSYMSDDIEVNPRLRTSLEEKDYDTIP